MWRTLGNWAANGWRTRRGLTVIVFLFALVAFPTLTYFLFKWAFGSIKSSGVTGATGSPLSYPLLFLGFASLIGTVFASNNTQSQVSYGILGLAFFCFILAIGPDYPLNIRLGRIMDQVLSSQGLALLAMSAGVVFVLKNTTNPTATKVLVGVLGVMAIVFAIPLLKEAIDPAKDGFKTLTGLEMNLNVVLLLTVIGILWKGDVQNRFVRFLLWLSLLIFIPASIGVMVKVIKDGFTDFTNQVPALTNIPTYLPDSTPDWFKELWAETVPALKVLPLGAKWVILGGTALFVVFLLYVFFRSRKSTLTPATSQSGGIGTVIALLVLIGFFFTVMYITGVFDEISGKKTTPPAASVPAGNTTILKGKVVESTDWEEVPKNQSASTPLREIVGTEKISSSGRIFVGEGGEPRWNGVGFRLGVNLRCDRYLWKNGRDGWGFYNTRGNRVETPPPQGTPCEEY